VRQRRGHLTRRRYSAAVDLSKLAWLVTVLICLLACGVLLVSGYQGYAGVLVAVALSAAINLR